MDKVTYKNEFNRQNYDQVIIMIPKGSKEQWKAEAKRRNISLNAMVQQAVAQYIDNTKEGEEQ